MSTTARQPVELPRGLIFLGSIWLTGSWLVSIGLRTPLQPVSASYTPGVRMMLLCLTLGLMIGWPLLRLSQRASVGPVRQTVLDVIVLMCLVQLVIWPLTLVTPWSPWRTAAIDGTLCAWLLLCAGGVAGTTGVERGGPRTIAMFCCVLLCVFGPLAGWVGQFAHVETAWLGGVGPVVEVLDLAEGGSEFPRWEQWKWIGFVGIADGALWVLLLVMSGFRRERDEAVPTGAAGG